jgi:hypothetical protein
MNDNWQEQTRMDGRRDLSGAISYDLLQEIQMNSVSNQNEM